MQGACNHEGPFLKEDFRVYQMFDLVAVLTDRIIRFKKLNVDFTINDG